MPFDDMPHSPGRPDTFPRPVSTFDSPTLEYQTPPPQPSTSTRNGTIRLFQVFGITVFLHWSWFVVAIFQIERRRGGYSSILWNVYEYLCLFIIVLMHEFGHALACRSVGGRADRIVLWPLGGVAFVSPPPRPGALLWSIVAGPMVNAILVPITWLFLSYEVPGWSWRFFGAWLPMGDVANFAQALFAINLGLLVFNMLPIYPLDGGQTLQALLWFVLGRARALLVAACIGIIGAVGLLVLAAYWQSIWTAVLAIFAGSMAWRGISTARFLFKMQNQPPEMG